METELILLRHGETAWNKELKFQGQIDIPLNKKGIEQAQKASKYLENKEVDVIYASDLKRAIKTAKIIAISKNLEVKELKALREMSFGKWEGFTYQEIEKEQKDLLASWVEDPVTNRPTNGETLKEFKIRIEASFQQIIRDNLGKKILVVSHGGVIRVYLSILLKMPLKDNWKLNVDNTAISIVKYYEQDPVLTLLNSKFHLKKNI